MLQPSASSPQVQVQRQYAHGCTAGGQRTGSTPAKRGGRTFLAAGLRRAGVPLPLAPPTGLQRSYEHPVSRPPHHSPSTRGVGPEAAHAEQRQHARPLPAAASWPLVSCATAGSSLPTRPTQAHTHTRTHTQAHTHRHAHTGTHAQARTHTHTQARIHTQARAHTQVCIHTGAHTRTHTHSPVPQPPPSHPSHSMQAHLECTSAEWRKRLWGMMMAPSSPQAVGMAARGRLGSARPARQPRSVARRAASQLAGTGRGQPRRAAHPARPRKAAAEARLGHASRFQHNTAQHSAAQRSTAQYNTAQHNTAQHSTAQHSAAQHSAAQHSTAQHSTEERAAWSHPWPPRHRGCRPGRTAGPC